MVGRRRARGADEGVGGGDDGGDGGGGRISRPGPAPLIEPLTSWLTVLEKENLPISRT